MSKQEVFVSHDTQSHGSLKSYTTGFIFSIILTIIPVAIVMNGWLEGTTNLIVLMVAASLQFVVQLVYFMHMGEEKKPRYNLITLLLGLFILLLVVVGSMWIMLFNMVAT